MRTFESKVYDKIYASTADSRFMPQMRCLRARRGSKDRPLTLVFANGCFDLLHPGQASLLNWAKTRPWILRPYLVVGLNHDEAVTNLKGDGRPIITFAYRAYLLASLACVDMVVGFEEDTPAALVERLEPDVLVKGEEYRGRIVPGQEQVESRGGVVAYAPRTFDVSTTQILTSICGRKGAKGGS